MMETKHTPGPWQYQPCYEGGLKRPYERFDIFRQEPDEINQDYGILIHGKTTFLATIRAVASKRCTEANATLIAAAPELFEALNLALDPKTAGTKETWNIGRAAIAKAEGAK